MRSIVAGIIAGCLLVSLPIHASAGFKSQHAQLGRDFPIHYDGPLIQHGPLFAGPNGLPAFGVVFHGGPVQTTTATYSIYWQPAGTFMSPRYKTLINRFLKDVGGSPIYGMATTYSGSNGQVQNVSTFVASIVDTTPYPAGGPTDADLQTEISKAIASNGWPTGVRVQYHIFTAKNAVPAPGYCAYHSAYNYKHNSNRPVVYEFTPYVGFENGCDPPYGITPNNDVDADGSIISVSHEQMEMVTDPLLNAWYGIGGEIGDICIFSFGVPYSQTGANMVIHGDPYFLQEDFSQALDGCQPNL